MASPVTPDDVKALLPTPGGDQCDSIGNALVGIPSKFYELIKWMLTDGGVATPDFAASLGLIVVGDIIPSASPALESSHRKLCNGQSLSRATYPALYAAIGTIYGTPDNSETFKLPDLRDRFPVSVGTKYDLGDTGGEDAHILTAGENAPHAHTPATNIVGFTFTGATSQPRATGPGAVIGIDNPAATGSGDISGTTITSKQPNTDAAVAHENRPPYFAVYWYIATGA